MSPSRALNSSGKVENALCKHSHREETGSYLKVVIRSCFKSFINCSIFFILESEQSECVVDTHRPRFKSWLWHWQGHHFEPFFIFLISGFASFKIVKKKKKKKKKKNPHRIGSRVVSVRENIKTARSRRQGNHGCVWECVCLPEEQQRFSRNFTCNWRCISRLFLSTLGRGYPPQVCALAGNTAARRRKLPMVMSPRTFSRKINIFHGMCLLKNIPLVVLNWGPRKMLLLNALARIQPKVINNELSWTLISFCHIREADEIESCLLRQCSQRTH